jgi:gluconolactonase
MPRNAPPQALVTNWHGRDFNSVNDVVVSKKDGSIWFTDPCYGYEQGFRRRPELPNQVYRFEPETGELRVVAGEFERCNGICFSPGEDRCYITDTGMLYGDGGRDLQRQVISTKFARRYANGGFVDRRLSMLLILFGLLHLPPQLRHIS